MCLFWKGYYNEFQPGFYLCSARTSQAYLPTLFRVRKKKQNKNNNNNNNNKLNIHITFNTAMESVTRPEGI